MSDFETCPVGTKGRLLELEMKLAHLKNSEGYHCTYEDGVLDGMTRAREKYGEIEKENTRLKLAVYDLAVSLEEDLSRCPDGVLLAVSFAILRQSEVIKGVEREDLGKEADLAGSCEMGEGLRGGVER